MEKNGLPQTTKRAGEGSPVEVEEPNLLMKEAEEHLADRMAEKPAKGKSDVV